MKISTRAHYGLRAVIAIAMLARDGVPVSVSDVARDENLSDTYLEQLVSKLRRAGILKSYRGAHGGYELVRDPSEITVADVLTASGEQVIFPECTSDCGCARAESRGYVCPSSYFWQSLCAQVHELATRTTVADLIEQYNADMERRGTYSADVKKSRVSEL